MCIRDRVEAAVVRAHRQAQALVFGHTVQHLLRKAACFGAEQEGIARLVGGLVVADRATRAKGCLLYTSRCV